MRGLIYPRDGTRYNDMKNNTDFIVSDNVI